MITKPFFTIILILILTMACSLPFFSGDGNKPSPQNNPALPGNIFGTVENLSTNIPGQMDTFKTINAPRSAIGPLPTPNYTPSKNMHSLGEVVNAGQLSWIVLSWYTTKDFGMPSPTLFVDILAVNRSDVLLYLPNSFIHKDSKGQDSYDTAVEYLNPGERVRITLSFLIESTPATLILEPDPDYGHPSNRILWDLGPIPASVLPPQQLKGEKEQKIYQVGETFRMGDLEIKVNKVDFPAKDKNQYEGYRYVAADIIFHNNGKKDIIIDSDLTGWIKDAENRIYGDYFNMGGGTIFPDGNLNTTIKNQVPVSAKGLLLVIDLTYLNLGKAFIRLSD